MNTVFHGSAGPLNVPECCCHRRHVTSRCQSHVVGQSLRQPVYQAFHKETIGSTPVGNIPVLSDEIVPTKTDVAEVSSAAVSIILYINSFKYTYSYKGGEDSDMSDVRGGQWCEGGEDSDVSDGRGGQWCEGGEDSDVSEGRMRGNG